MLGSCCRAVFDARVRVLILGAGIAGTLLARELHRPGVSVVVADDTSAPSASRAAAGLVNPITGIRLTLVPGIQSLMAAACGTFAELEKFLQRPVWHPLPVDRIFRTAEEAEYWNRRSVDPAYGPWSAPLPPGTCPAPLGGIRIRGGGWFDYRCLPEVLEKEGIPRIDGAVDTASIGARDDAVYWQGERFDAVVFCQGYAADDPWFTGLPWKSALGEILTVRAEAGPVDSIWMRGIFIVPLGDGLFRTGSTYRWNGFDRGTTPEAREEILGGWRALGLPEPVVVDQKAGVRPVLQDRQPILGRHPRRRACWICNGLGSRGAMFAPTVAVELAEALTRGIPIRPEWDAARFFRRA